MAVLGYIMEQEPHVGNKGNSHMVCLVDAESCTPLEFTVTTGSAQAIIVDRASPRDQ